ncbi:Neuropathy target esterase [Ascosphaera pollenicola]|nr:Neuropathy target esterase [Ascosphaera pollenicola]
MPPNTRSRSRKKQTRLTFSPAPSSAVPAGSPVSEKRSPAFVRFARPGQINSFYSTDPTARKRKRPDNTVSEKPASSDKTGLPLSDSEGSPSRKKGKKAALSVSHSKSIADEALSTAEGNASPAPQEAFISKDFSPDMESPMFSRPSSKRKISVELKQKERQQKLEKAKRAAAKTRSLVKKAKSQQRSDKVIKQQAKLAKREERLEKLRSKLEEQQRKLEEERNKLRQASQAESDSEPETSDIELPSSPQPQSFVTTNSGRPSVVGPAPSNAYFVSLSDTDSDDVKPATSNKTKAKQSEDAIDHSEGSEDDIIASSQPQRRRRSGREHSNEPLEEPHGDDDLKPHTPRLKRGLMRPQEGSHEERGAARGDEERDQNQLDLEDDLDFLEDSAVKDTRTRGTVANSAKAKRMAYLDQLRKRRTGKKRQKEESSTSTEEEELEDGAQEDSKKTGPEEQHDTSSDDDDESQPDQSIEDLDQDDSDFVVESDPDDTLGAPDSEAVLPLKFSRHKYKKLSEYFRDVVEWMVHNQLNPAFPRDDPVYQMAFNKINDEAMGKTKSQYISSAWSSQFIRALEARPVLESQDSSGQASCDACGRSSHYGRFKIVLKGKPYSLQTLRPLTDGEDEEPGEEEAEEQDRSEGEEDEHESSESDSQSEDDQRNEDGAEGESDEEDDQEYDRQGNPIPPEGTSFRVGTNAISQCHHNALSAHAVIHWRYELNEWVVGWLEENQILTKKEIRRRRKWSVKLQTDFANEVVDFMIESKEVQRLWKDFRRSGRRVRMDHRFNQVGDVDINE